MSLQDSLMQENLYLRLFPDLIKTRSQKEWHGEKSGSARQVERCRTLPIWIRRMSGRRYETDVIRINSQSGKGGVNYILKQSFGISLPEKMKEEVGYLVKGRFRQSA